MELGSKLGTKLLALGAVASLTLISACASTSESRKGSSDGDLEATAQATPTRSTSNPKMVTHSEIILKGVKLENLGFDYPITLNSRVEYWVDYFTGKGRKHFVRYLERSELFIPYIVPLLKNAGVPEDLVYLAMIESGFNNHARSFAKAVGPWQFMPATGKRFGLAVNWWVDERRDTHKSTLAAIQYLRDLHSIFNSWELAAAAYNAGESKVARAIRRYGTTDFWVLSRHRFLRPETRDYVPKIIAAALLSKNRHLFGFPASGIKPADDEAISPSGELVKVIKESNPVAPTPATVKADQQESLQSVLQGEYDEYEDAPETLAKASELPAAEEAPNPLPAVVAAAEFVPLAKPIATPKVSKKGEVSGEMLAEFELKSPADLLKVARAAGLSYQTVKSLNPELLRWCTPPNSTTYRVKLPISTKDKFMATYNHEAFPRQVQFMSYKVRQGENLQNIARRYGIRVDPVAELNRVHARSPLRAGATVVLPMPNDRSRTLASLEVLDPPERHRRTRRLRRGGRRYYKVTYKRRESARARARDSDPS